MRLHRVAHAEIIHYASAETTISSHANKVRIEHREDRHVVELPARAWELAPLRFRLSRRALRLDKCNVMPVFEDSRLTAVVVIRQGRVYHVAYPSGTITETLHLRQCRNVLHQSICVSDAGHFYFGEYGSNPSRETVPVYRSIDAGRSWHVIYEFPKGSVRHVHGCHWDPIAKRVWVSTGDFENENVMLSADENFSSPDWHGDGGQAWRTCHPFFLPEAVIWAMDSQLETSHLCRFDRTNGRLEKLQPFPGPVWYGKALTDGWFVLATANEIGPGVKDDSSHVFASRDALDWQPVLRVRHDGFPKGYFKFGVIGFADGAQSSREFYLFAEALSGMDGRAYRCAIDLDG